MGQGRGRMNHQNDGVLIDPPAKTLGKRPANSQRDAVSGRIRENTFFQDDRISAAPDRIIQ